MKKEAPAPEYLKSEASVWWEMDKCPIPDGYDPRRVAECIKSELEKLGYSGPLSINGCGNLKHVPGHILQALLSTGIILNHLPTETSQTTMLSLMQSWKNKIKGPYTMMFISDSRGFDEFHGGLAFIQTHYQANMLLALEDPMKEEDYALVVHQQFLWKNLIQGAKCSGTGDFSCSLCQFVCQNLEEATKHLNSDSHALAEFQLKRPSCSYPKRTTTTTMLMKQRNSKKRFAKKMKMTYEHLPQQEEEACL